MDGFVGAVGRGIAGLVGTAWDVIMDAIRGTIGTLNAVVPFGLFPVVAFAALAGTAWVLAKR